MAQRLHLALDPAADAPPEDVTGYAEGAPFVTKAGKIYVLTDGSWVLGAGGAGSGGITKLLTAPLLTPLVPFDITAWNQTRTTDKFKIYENDVELSGSSQLSGYNIYGGSSNMQIYPFFGVTNTSSSTNALRVDVKFDLTAVPANQKVKVKACRGTGYIQGTNHELYQLRVYVNNVERTDLRLTGRPENVGYVLGTGPTATTVTVNDGENGSQFAHDVELELDGGAVYFVGTEMRNTAPDNGFGGLTYYVQGKHFIADVTGLAQGTLVSFGGKNSILGFYALEALASFDVPDYNPGQPPTQNDPYSYNVIIGADSDGTYPMATGWEALMYEFNPQDFPTLVAADYPDGLFYGNAYSVFIGPGVVIMPDQEEAVVLGDYAVAAKNPRDPFENGYNVAIGAYSFAVGESTAVGAESYCYGSSSLAMGYGAEQYGNEETMVGYYAYSGKVFDAPNTSITTTPMLDTENAIFGTYAGTDDQVLSATSVGGDAYCAGPNLTQAIPAGRESRWEDCTALGHSSFTRGDEASSLGANSFSRHQSLAVGVNATAVAGDTFQEIDKTVFFGATAVGYGSGARATGATALGYQASATATALRSTVLGFKAKTDRPDIVELGATEASSGITGLLDQVPHIPAGKLELTPVTVNPDTTAGKPMLYVHTDGTLRFKKADGTLQTVSVV